MTVTHCSDFEVPQISTLDDAGRDRYLERLVKVHGAPRFDIAPQITTARRMLARHVAAAAELMPVA